MSAPTCGSRWLREIGQQTESLRADALKRIVGALKRHKRQLVV
jgi:hypothetical protein